LPLFDELLASEQETVLEVVSLLCLGADSSWLADVQDELEGPEDLD
jgi:hypothetical protein